MSLAQKTGKSKQAVSGAKTAKAPSGRADAKAPAASTKTTPIAPAKTQAAVALKALAAARKSAEAVKAAPKAAAPVKAAAKPVSKTPDAIAKVEAPAKASAAVKAAAPVKSAPGGVANSAAPMADKAVKKTIVSTAAPVSSAPEMPVPVEPAAAPKPSAQPLVRKAVDKLAKPASSPKRNGFATLEYIVYPAHGVGQIIAVEEQEVAGFKLELFVISFIKDKMILKVPVPKVASVGMRKLADEPIVKRSLDTLTGRARIKRTMWSRRAQEYEAKINSGDLVAIAEVVRDLYRSEAQPEQSYSERQLYEAALDRIAREIGTVLQLTETEALKLIETNLQKGPRRTRAEVEAEAETDEGNVEEEAA